MSKLNITDTHVTTRSRIDSFFRKLPFFMPWVWEMFVLIAILAFAFGMGLGTWADRSLMK